MYVVAHMVELIFLTLIIVIAIGNIFLTYYEDQQTAVIKYIAISHNLK